MYSMTISCTENADVLYQALKTEETKGKRFEVEIKKGADDVQILIMAHDATALKAIGGSMIRLLEAAEKIHGRK